MAKKKNTQIAVSQEDNTQAQHILEQYHEIAGNLHTSTDQKQAEDALTEINNMPEGAQIALLKALSKELDTDAADVLIERYASSDFCSNFGMMESKISSLELKAGAVLKISLLRRQRVYPVLKQRIPR